MGRESVAECRNTLNRRAGVTAKPCLNALNGAIHSRNAAASTYAEMLDQEDRALVLEHTSYASNPCLYPIAENRKNRTADERLLEQALAAAREHDNRLRPH